MRVLALDGGGIRGLIPALVLAEIERRTGRAIRELVDLVAGTSTGAILACALTQPDPLPAARIAELYVEEGPRIFDRSLLKRITSVDGYLDERYDDDGLRTVLERWLGTARLADADPAILVTVYDLERRRAVLLRRADDLSMVDAAHASSAAPTYFEPVRAGGATLVDGGVFAINPAALAYAEVVGNRVSRSDPRKLGSPRDVTLVSLGTGAMTRPLPYDEVRGWGRLEWAEPILDVVFDGSADAVDLQLSALLEDGYIRLQTPLVEASDDLDDASEGNLAALAREAERLIAARDADIDRVCERLTNRST